MSAETMTPRSRAQTSTQKRGEARRREILDTATSLFSAGGFNTVSLADIAREVGITQAGILHYFPTKAALLLAVLQEREARNIASRERHIEEGMSPLAAYIATLKENDQNPELVQLFVVLAAEATAVDHPGHTWFAVRNENLVTSMTDMVSRTVDESRLPDGVTATTIARWVLGLAHGLGAQWVLDTAAFDRAGQLDLFMKVLEPYLLSSADPSPDH